MLNKTTIFPLFGAFILAIIFGASYITPTPPSVIRVIDGDTIKIEAPYLPESLGKELSLRLEGIDTPEDRRAKCDKEKLLSKEATEFVKEVLDNAQKREFIINGWDKYGGRVLGDILIDGKSLAKMLLDKGYAVEYHGTGTKKDWCI